jgi:hypothetical protein
MIASLIALAPLSCVLFVGGVLLGGLVAASGWALGRPQKRVFG